MKQRNEFGRNTKNLLHEGQSHRAHAIRLHEACNVRHVITAALHIVFIVARTFFIQLVDLVAPAMSKSFNYQLLPANIIKLM